MYSYILGWDFNFFSKCLLWNTLLFTLMHLWSNCHPCCCHRFLPEVAEVAWWIFSGRLNVCLEPMSRAPIRAPSQYSPLFLGHRHQSFTVWSHFVSGVGGGPTRREVLWLAQCTCQLRPHLGGVAVRPAHWREAKGWSPWAPLHTHSIITSIFSNGKTLHPLLKTPKFLNQDVQQQRY